MLIPFLPNYKHFLSFLLLHAIILSFNPAIVCPALVTLRSLEIFKTHEWLKAKPTVYFYCHGENKTILPDVKEAHVPYTFKDEESWQPLTSLLNTKCKRCGFYEKDTIKSDDIYDEWELCPSDFKEPRGTYIHFKENELNVTFLCPDCLIQTAQDRTSENTRGGSGIHVLIVLLVGSLCAALLVLVVILSYKYWKKRRNEQEHARFMKLFDDGEDMDSYSDFAGEI